MTTFCWLPPLRVVIGGVAARACATWTRPIQSLDERAPRGAGCSATRRA